ncbi:MAG: hypothetical protein JOZ24_05770 [Candidatus Eremiobacteraeota bacterium]|nr:hypothetical protein [Candidatus Eremiobacteraeota bacterium]
MQLRAAALTLALALASSPGPATAQEVATPSPPPAASPAPTQHGTPAYRGFTVDMSSVGDDATVRSAVEHQIDIVADSGVRDEILAFFRAQRIVVRRGAVDRFSRQRGIEIDTRLPVQQPIALHELLHAYQAFVLADGPRNPDILGFFEEARRDGLYPPNAYVLRNPMEFFAVTGSLYLWGHVDRPPFDRATLKRQQPRYYAWLAQLFGVEK